MLGAYIFDLSHPLLLIKVMVPLAFTGPVVHFEVSTAVKPLLLPQSNCPLLVPITILEIPFAS